MKTYFLTIFFGILLLAAGYTPTTTPTAIPTETPPQPPTSIISDTLTSTPISLGRTIVVTSTFDSGSGSLRKALLDAQNSDTIAFDQAVFPPGAPVAITVVTELPHIHQIDHLTLDASDAGVVLDGSQLQGDWMAGLQIVMSDGVTIRGLPSAAIPEIM